jgi:hypothetical protein
LLPSAWPPRFRSRGTAATTSPHSPRSPARSRLRCDRYAPRPPRCSTEPVGLKCNRNRDSSHRLMRRGAQTTPRSPAMSPVPILFD